MAERMDGWKEIRVDEQTMLDEQMDTQMDGWTHEWVDTQMQIQIDG